MENTKTKKNKVLQTSQTNVAQNDGDGSNSLKVSQLDKETIQQVEQVDRFNPEPDNGQRYQELPQECIDLNKANEQLRTENEQLHWKIKELQNENETLRKKNADLRKKVRQTQTQGLFGQIMCKIRPAKEVRVQMYAAVNQHLCEKIMDELDERLSLKFKQTYISAAIKVHKLQQPPSAECSEDNVPLIVICMNASRLEIDVDKALKDVNNFRTIAVVVLHHQDLHALPEDYSKGIFSKTHGAEIIDIAYLTTKGIYQCEMNDVSLGRLVEIVMGSYDEKK